MPPILILGGGINGAAAARELALNGASVWLVDTADLSYGATAYSSRLIHGGLRYLEFAEFSLVRESLAERGRLLRLAPHLVKPLRLFIPIKNSWGGLIQAAGKFLRLPLRGKKAAPRGLRVVHVGLWLYDRYARGQTTGRGYAKGATTGREIADVATSGRGDAEGLLPARSLHRPGDAAAPQVPREVARWLWAYSDAQVTYPERLVVGLLADARQLARERGSDFRVFTYSRATLHGDTVEIRPTGDDAAEPLATLQPAAIVNATGAWVDETLRRLPLPSRRLMGGTKGSHFLTHNPRLKERLRGHGLYTEARDGRPVFLLPFGEGVLVGTTDIPFEGDPATAVATDEELDYLLDVVEGVFPGCGLARDDVTMHYCGVRPLPYVDAKTPAAITRRHQLVWNEASPVPLVSLVGGKLTTCRSLAEETAAAVLGRLNRPIEANSRERPIPPTEIDQAIAASDGASSASLDPALIRSAIDNEWATRLEDLVERRLMLHFSPHLSRDTLEALAAALVDAGKLDEGDVPAAIDRCATRLRTHFGLRLPPNQDRET